MFKKWWNSFCYSLGLSTLLSLLISLIASNTQIKVVYVVLCVLLPTHIFNFFTFELKLFSKHIWVRRAITIGFSILIIITVCALFSGRWFSISLAILLSIMVLLTIFAYYISDKIEKRNLDAINRELANRNMNANNK